MLKQTIKNFFKNESGMEPVYVAILLVMVSVLIVAAIKYLGPIVYSSFEKTGELITESQDFSY